MSMYKEARSAEEIDQVLDSALKEAAMHISAESEARGRADGEVVGRVAGILEAIRTGYLSGITLEQLYKAYGRDKVNVALEEYGIDSDDQWSNQTADGSIRRLKFE